MTWVCGNRQHRCSFCGKSQQQVEKLIPGRGVRICDECVALCNKIIAGHVQVTR